jgi:RNA polymerase subunit RPABC4/transcription elongation factor Spt4
VFEVLEMTEPLRRLVASGAQESMIRKAAAEEGMSSIGKDGMKKILAGETTLEELQRVVYYEEEMARVCPACHESLSAEHRYCPHCGRASEVLCAGCQHRLDPEWDYCPSCGSHHDRKAESSNETLVGLPEEPRPGGAERDPSESGARA